MTAIQPITKQAGMMRPKPLASRIFLLIAPLLYAAYALLTPPFQTPDEQQHLFRAWQLSELQLLGERRGNSAGGVLPASLGRAALPEIGTLEAHVTRNVVVRPFGAAYNHGTPLETNGPRLFFDFRGSVFYSPAGYVPQIVAIWLGRPIGLSVENIIRLGRLFNSAITILLIYWALSLTPIGSFPLMWVGLLPMSAAASASFGQDGLVIGGACLLTAIGLRVVLNGRWARFELLITAGVTLAVVLSKIFYLPLAMVGGGPFASRASVLRRLIVPSLICIASTLTTAVWLHQISGLVVPLRSDIPPPTDRLAEWLHHPTIFFMLLERTYIQSAPYLLGTLFKFGWLNVGPVRTAEFLSVVALCLTLFAGDADAGRVRWKTRLWLLLIAASVVVLISAAIVLYSRPATELWIEGVQARYFIPIAPAVLIALLPQRADPPPYRLLVVPLMIAANIFALRSIFLAFYS